MASLNYKCVLNALDKERTHKLTSDKRKIDKPTDRKLNSKDQNPFMHSQIDACIHSLVVERHLIIMLYIERQPTEYNEKWPDNET